MIKPALVVWLEKQAFKRGYMEGHAFSDKQKSDWAEWEFDVADSIICEDVAFFTGVKYKAVEKVDDDFEHGICSEYRDGVDAAVVQAGYKMNPK